VGSKNIDTEHAKDNTLFEVFKALEAKAEAKIKIKTNQLNHINFSQLNFSTFSDWQECDEEINDASTC
jgi:hypothetical protein